MLEEHDAGHVNDLEAVFRSRELSQVTRSGSGGRSLREDRDEMGLGSRPSEQAEAASSAGGAAAAAVVAPVSAKPPWRHGRGPYWTMTVVSALAALVVAGVTADTGQQRSSNRSAHGAHETLRPHGRAGSPGASSTAPTAPGSFTGAVGSGAVALSVTSAQAHRSGNDPGERVTLGAAATTAGALPPPSGGSPGAGSASPATTGSSGTTPEVPSTAGVGSTVAVVGYSVTGLANQLGGAVPATAPATSTVKSAVSGVLNSFDEVVDATTL